MFAQPLAMPIASPIARTMGSVASFPATMDGGNLPSHLEERSTLEEAKTTLEGLRQNINAVERQVQAGNAPLPVQMAQVGMLKKMSEIQQQILGLEESRTQLSRPPTFSSERQVIKYASDASAQEQNLPSVSAPFTDVDQLRNQLRNAIIKMHPKKRELFGKLIVSDMPENKKKMMLSQVLAESRKSGLGEDTYWTDEDWWNAYYSYSEDTQPTSAQTSEQTSAIVPAATSKPWTATDYSNLFGSIGSMIAPLSQAGVGIFQATQQMELAEQAQEYQQSMLQQQMQTQQALAQATARVNNLAASQGIALPASSASLAASQGTVLPASLATSTGMMLTPVATVKAESEFSKYLPWIAGGAAVLGLTFLLVQSKNK